MYIFLMAKTTSVNASINYIKHVLIKDRNLYPYQIELSNAEYWNSDAYII